MPQFAFMDDHVLQPESRGQPILFRFVVAFRVVAVEQVEDDPHAPSLVAGDRVDALVVQMVGADEIHQSDSRHSLALSRAASAAMTERQDHPKLCLTPGTGLRPFGVYRRVKHRR
jgi:hypothetical protein